MGVDITYLDKPMSSHDPNSQTLAILKEWSNSLIKASLLDGAYLFGSLIYRGGSQFSELSDIDLIVLLSGNAHTPMQRVKTVAAIRGSVETLEQGLLKVLSRTDASKPTCSVVAVTKLEIEAGIHKDGADQFFKENRFLDLTEDKLLTGLPMADTAKIENRFQSSSLRFGQKKRNAFLSISANGTGGLLDFDGAEPLPKDIMRQAAMTKQLHSHNNATGAEYDVQYGLDFITNLLFTRSTHDSDYQPLNDSVSIRRGARGERRPLSGGDQLLLVELLYEHAEQSVLASREQADSSAPSIQGRDSTVEFATRFAQAFPGVRGIQWFDAESEIQERLGKLMQAPLLYAETTPIWWWRDGNMHIERFVHQKERVFLMDDIELDIRRIAAVGNASYFRQFVYVELNPMHPTGLYEHSEQHIVQVQNGEGLWSYHWEEYGLVDGKHFITRGEFDDGAANIDGKLQDIRGRAELRVRYVTPYNFVIAPNGSPINNPDFDQTLEKLLDTILHGTGNLESLVEAVNRLPKRQT